MKAISQAEIERRLNLLYRWVSENDSSNFLYESVEIEFEQYNTFYWELKCKTNSENCFNPKTEYYSMIETNQI